MTQVTPMAGAADVPGVTDFGVVAPRDEARTAAVCVNPAGESRLVIAARGWVLVVDVESGRCHQLHLPGATDFPFASMASRKGIMWTGAGKALYEVDPFARTVTRHQPCRAGDATEIVGMAFAEGPDGRIWFTTYPDCALVVMDPASGLCIRHARLSTTEQYAAHLAVDDGNRVYAGIGTEHRDVVVVSPTDPQPRSVVPGGPQGKGSGYVRRGVDGSIHAHWDSEQLHPLPEARHRWHRLTEGGPVPVAEGDIPASATCGRGFARIHVPIQPGWTVERLDLPGAELVVADGTGATRRLPLQYASAGAKLAPFAMAGDGRVVGTSSHPLRLFRLDPVTATVDDLGVGALARAGGNVCAWARVGDDLYGVAYAGGHLYRYDPAAPISSVNPRHLVAYEQVHRPRCIVAHPDARHLVWGGHGGYGDTGGGLAVHRVDGSTVGVNRVVDHLDLVPHHATTALGVLSNGDLVGATSVETPGGARRRASVAVVYRLAWPGLDVVGLWQPDRRVTSWSGLVVAADDTVHLISDLGRHVHLDPVGGSVLASDDWAGGGRLARAGVVVDGAGRRAAILQADAITLLDLADHSARSGPGPGAPITAGGVLTEDAVLVGCGTRLVSVPLTHTHSDPHHP